MFRALGLLLLAATANGRVGIPAMQVDDIAGEYIVELHANITDADHTALAAQYGALKKFKIGGTYRAMYVKMDEVAMARFAEQNVHVKQVSRNGIARALQTCSGQGEPVSWGQVRTTAQAAGDVSQVFQHVPSWGSGVDAYVADTGIDCGHPEFTGRCTFGANFAGGGNNDPNGHGTHCAGTIGGSIYGVAKATHLIAVKVLGDSGSGSWAGIIEGMEWITNQMRQTGRPSIASLSLGGGGNTGVDNACDAAQSAGVHVVIAAGNSNANACNYSPARAPLPTCVGSTELTTSGGQPRDGRSSFSNHGTCVDIFAPGSSIISAYRGGYATLSGTSMACPHVAGGLSVHLTRNPGSPSSEAKQFMLDSAMATDILNRGTGSPDRMFHVQC